MPTVRKKILINFRWAIITCGIIFCSVISRPLLAAQSCVSVPNPSQGERPEDLTKWNVITSPEIEFREPGDEQCQISFVVPKPSTFTLLLEELHAKTYIPSQAYVIEQIDQNGLGHRIQNIGSFGLPARYVSLESSGYPVTFNLYTQKQIQKPTRFRLSFGKFDLFSNPIPVVNKNSVLVVGTKSWDEPQVSPFQIEQRAFVQFALPRVCYTNLTNLIPSDSTLIETKECKEKLGPFARLPFETQPFLGNTILIDANGRPIYPQLNELNMTGKEYEESPYYPNNNAFILPKGQYALITRFKHSSNKEATGHVVVVTKVSELNLEPFSPTVEAYNGWLNATGLGEYFSLVDLYSMESAETKSCTDPREMFYQRLLFAVIDNRRTTDSSKENAEFFDFPCAPTNKQKVLISQQEIPKVVLIMSMNFSHDLSLVEFESKFEKKFGLTVWDRLFLKVGFGLGLSQKQIVMFIPEINSVCWNPLAYWHNGHVQRPPYRFVCDSAGYGISVQLPELGLGDSYKSEIPITRNNLGDLMAQFIQNYYTKKGATVQFLDRQKSFVEAIIRGLRGEVLLGGRDWEKLQVTMSVLSSEKNEIQIRDQIDGFVASGMLNPPDSNYTTSMEPHNSGALTQYSRRFLDDFRNEITKTK